jgi:hypothetical protein
MQRSYRPSDQPDHPEPTLQPGSLLRRLRESPQDAIERIAGTIGARRATSLGEAQAAAYLDGRMRRAGLRVSADALDAPSGIVWDGIALAPLALASAILYYWLPLPSLALLLWDLAIATVAFLRPSNPLLARRRPTQNVIATRALETTPRWRVVVLAPLDTPAAIGPRARRLIAGTRPLFGRLIATAAMLVLGFAALVGPVEIRRLFWYGQFVAVIYLCVLAGCELWAARARASAGAANHAGALAALLECADRLAALTNTELWAVALGATTTGAGLADLLRRYPFDRQMTLFIGLESIGSGLLSYVTREGWLPQRPADSLLVRLVAEMDAADPLINVEPRPYYSEPTLLQLLHRGRYRALTVIGLDAEGSPAQRGSLADTPEQISPEIVDRAVRLVVGVVKQIDETAANP